MAVDPHVKTALYDRPRSSTPLPPASGFVARRPGEVVEGGQPSGPLLGVPGPDLGYGLLLARRFADRLELGAGEHPEDALAVGAELAGRRAATGGRAPVLADVEWALTLLGYLGGAPDDLAQWRRRHVQGARREYAERRGVVEAVRPEALDLGADEVRQKLGNWRDLLDPGR